MIGQDGEALPGPDQESVVREETHTPQRRQAEARLRQQKTLLPEEIPALSPEAIAHLLHELRVHQIELEMQNEELRESQIALDAARERYFDLYDLAPVGYFAISESGFIRQANLAAADLFGMVRSALINQPLSRRIMVEDQDIYYQHRKLQMQDDQAQAFELRMTRADGTQFWARLVVTSGHDANGAREFRAVVSDIDERRHAEEARLLLQQELLHKNAELESARAIADKSNQAKSDFLSNMSHELRTPLHAILGFGQLLESGTPAPTSEQLQSVGQILKAGWHLLGLINEILDLSIIEAGKVVLNMEPLPLSEIVRECETMLEPMMQTRGIRILCPQVDMHHVVWADPLRLKQVLINLLSNAVKYNRLGGTVSIHCSTLKDEKRLRIDVADEGRGLTQGEIGQLFQPFSRLGKDAEKEEGAGIGLVVCKRLIELMDGSIGVKSIPGKGSIFWIELDAAQARQSSEPTVAPRATLPIDGQAGRDFYTLLYVEDNLANLMLIEAIVARRPNIRLLSAPDGMRGMEMAREFIPDIILMDIDLPDMSGFEVLKMLESDLKTRAIPVIALSADAMQRDIDTGLQAGFLRYLTKPINIDEFMMTLDENLPIVHTA
jgi:PAS domain S-box-containing protein